MFRKSKRDLLAELTPLVEGRWWGEIIRQPSTSLKRT